MDADDEDLFVIGAIEDADAPPLGQACRRPPQEIVIEIGGAWMLEAEDLAALRVDAGHDVLDHAVLAGRVHRLKDQQQGVPVVRVEQILALGELPDVCLKQRPIFLLRSVERRDARGPLLQIEAPAFADAERFDVE